MAMLDEDYAVFMAHLQKQHWWGAGSCPICGSRNWETHGPVAYSAYDGDALKLLSMGITPAPTSVMPTALLICAVCSHVMQFAWRPIKDAALRATADMTKAAREIAASIVGGDSDG